MHECVFVQRGPKFEIHLQHEDNLRLEIEGCVFQPYMLNDPILVLLCAHLELGSISRDDSSTSHTHRQSLIFTVLTIRWVWVTLTSLTGLLPD